MSSIRYLNPRNKHAGCSLQDGEELRVRWWLEGSYIADNQQRSVENIALDGEAEGTLDELLVGPVDVAGRHHRHFGIVKGVDGELLPVFDRRDVVHQLKG